jgi:3-deoxy-manno-octulosonate cytidylyltransferase (CMP-KDO synthetase)
MLKIEKTIENKIDIVVMVQGDEPMVTSVMIKQAVEPLINNNDIHVVNIMGELNSIEDFEDSNEVKVVIDKQMNALYFSREPIPSRKKGIEHVPMYKQVCIIPFRRDYLLKFNAMPETVLEQIESVDMLRILENGQKVRMVYCDTINKSVDTPEDLEQAEILMRDDPLLKTYMKQELYKQL